jgi:hypothetical protein
MVFIPIPDVEFLMVNLQSGDVDGVLMPPINA